METDSQTPEALLSQLNNSLRRYSGLRLEAQQHQLSAWERYFLAQEQQLGSKINRLSRSLSAARPAPHERAGAVKPSRRLRTIVQKDTVEDEATPRLRFENPRPIRHTWRSA